MRFLLRFHDFYQNTYDFHWFPYENRCGSSVAGTQTSAKTNKNHRYFVKISLNFENHEIEGYSQCTNFRAVLYH